MPIEYFFRLPEELRNINVKITTDVELKWEWRDDPYNS
jgi:hypothetical protein